MVIVGVVTAVMKQNTNLKHSLLTTLLIGSLMAPAAAPAMAALGSLSIDAAVLQMLTDADANGIANIGDTISLQVTLLNTDGYAETNVSADLRPYGLSASEGLIAGAGEDDNIFTKTFVISDAGLLGIDVAADNALSAVLISANDDDEVAPVIGTSNPLGIGHGAVDANNGVDTATPINQNNVFNTKTSARLGAAVAIASAAEAGGSVWFAPLNTTEFVASSTKTRAAGNATSITAPQTAGDYRLYVIDRAGQVSEASTAQLAAYRAGGGGAAMKSVKSSKKSQVKGTSISQKKAAAKKAEAKRKAAKLEKLKAKKVEAKKKAAKKAAQKAAKKAKSKNRK